jgi:hypothetical protein
MTNSSIDLSKNCDQLTIDCLTDLSPKTKGMVLDILALHTDPDKNDSLINAIIIYLPDKNYERGLKLLQNPKTGILDN